MQAIWRSVRRALARVGRRREQRRLARDRDRRRRRRILDWEAVTRRPAKGAGKSDGCAFCSAARDWLRGQWRRGVDAVYTTSGFLAGLFERVRGPLRQDSPRSTPPTLRRVLRRHDYPGSRPRRYDLHVPASYDAASPMPLVVVLHGCRQTSGDIRHISDFDAVADREGFIVAYPFVTSYSGLRIRNCWGWWIEEEIRPGAGEVEDLWQIVEQTRADLNVDPRRIHVAGLSSGAGMAVAAMVTHHDRIASGAAVAGVAYSETPRAVAYGAPGGVQFRSTEDVVGAMAEAMASDGRPSPVLIVHSADDPVVPIEAAGNLRDSWAPFHGIDPARPAAEKSGTTGATSWVHRRYRTPMRRSAVETLFLEGPGHGWYGGRAGKFSFPDAPDVSSLIWKFCKRHPLYSEAFPDGVRAHMSATV